MPTLAAPASGALNAGLAGMINASRDMLASGRAAMQATTPRPVEPVGDAFRPGDPMAHSDVPDLPDAIMGLKTGALAYSASAAVVRAAAGMNASLLDLVA